MDAEHLESAISGMDASISQDIKTRDRLMQEWALLVSPWKVGDVTDGKGYTFTGKRCQVTKISGRKQWGGQLNVLVTACVLKANGEPSKQFTEWYWNPKRS